MAPVLHKHGVTAEKAKGLAADWNAMVAAQVADMDKADADAAAAMNSKNTAEAAARSGLFWARLRQDMYS
jgi:hypothetical protein